jgi:hypothetical protein
MTQKEFGAKRVYPSEEGLHFELYTQAEAQAAYDDAKNRNVSVELNGLILTWKFPNPKKSHNNSEEALTQ